MSVRNYSSTAAQTTLTGGVNASATALSVSGTTGFPAAPFILAVDAGAAAQELVLVTNVAGNVLTVTRGYDSTVAVDHDTGAVVAHSHGAIEFREANAHVNATSGVHGVAGALVGLADVQALLLAAHPVGDIKMSTVNVNPATYLGGTWVAWGSGRVPVGVSADAEFNTVEKTGGAKTHTLTVAEMPSHDHGGVTGNQNASHTHSTGVSNTTAFGTAGSGGYSLPSSAGTSGLQTSSEIGNHGHAITAQGGGGAHNNLQPYITCYMFKRTA